MATKPNVADWQRASTAPRDGTEILLLVNTHGVVLGVWQGNERGGSWRIRSQAFTGFALNGEVLGWIPKPEADSVG